MRPLAPEEVERFRRAAARDPYRLVFDLMLATGVRPSEALAWQWQDWSKVAGTITVQRVLNLRGEEAVFAEPKTARSRRTIPLPASANKALLEHFVAAADKAPTALVFPSPKGGPLDERALVRRHFKPILEAAELPATIRLYDLRHTHATALLVAGENPKVVSERLGHASITLTLDTYSHVLPTTQQAAAAKVEALLFGTGEARA
jgi:integrase